MFSIAAMSEVSQNLILGVIGGVVTSILIWVSLVVWRKQLRPAWEKMHYKGFDVSGKWNLVELDGKTGEDIGFAEKLDLSQSAHRLTGTDRVDSDGRNLTYSAVGEIRDSFVSLRMNLTSRKRLGYAIVLCRIEGDGEEMSGFSAFFDREAKELTQSSATYKRLAE